MKIYRVQNAHGIGPFQNEPVVHDMAIHGRFFRWRWSYIDEQHPSPWSDNLEDHLRKDNMVFGCPGITSFLHWFGPILDVMGELGFDVLEYDTTEYVVGKSQKQVLFIPSEAKSFRILSDKELSKIHQGYLDE